MNLTLATRAACRRPRPRANARNASTAALRTPHS